MTQLVKLDASDNCHVTTVAPFGSSLIELHAGSPEFDDAGRHGHNRLSVCIRQSTDSDVAPFGSTLLELDVSKTKISDAALSGQQIWFAGLLET